MWFSSALRRCPTAISPRKFFPALEPLEERTVPAAVFNVTSLADSNVPGSGSLRRAITDSNNTPGPNTIRILAPGTYNLTLLGVENNNIGGDLDILNNKVDIDNQSGGT